MKCNICGSEMHFLDLLEEHESEVTKVYSEPNCSKSVDITFYQCPVCTHGQIGNIIEKEYYQEYELIRNTDRTGVRGGVYTDFIRLL